MGTAKAKAHHHGGRTAQRLKWTGTSSYGPVHGQRVIRKYQIIYDEELASPRNLIIQWAGKE